MKSLLSNKLYILALVLIFTPGCRKDPPVVETINDKDTTCIEEWCYDLPPDGGFGYNFIVEGPQYYRPRFNPNNSNEFVYTRRGVSINPELVKYNLETNEQVVLLDPMSLGLADWGRKGTIVFIGSGGIWKVNDNGTNLQQLTNGVMDLYPIHNFSGERIVYYRGKTYNNAELAANPSLYEEYKMMVIDLIGNEVDSVMASNLIPGNYYQKWQFGKFNKQEEIYFIGGSELSEGFYLMNSDLDSIYPGPIRSLFVDDAGILSMDYSNGYIYYSTFRNGIFKIDVETGGKQKIKIGCGTRYYNCISVSSDGSKMLAEKVISDPINNYDIVEKHEIWLLDLVGCGEERILGQ